MSIIKRDYEKGYFENFFYKEKIDSQRNINRVRILREYKDGGKLLELGCGEGRFLDKAQDYFEVEGFDVSEYAITSAKKTLGDKVKKYDVKKTNLRSSSYDVVVAFNLLEHLEAPKQTLDDLYCSLTSEGIFIGSVPNNFGLVGGLVTLLSNIFDRTHCSTYSPKIWEEYFKEVGFNEIFLFGEVTIGRNRNLYIKNIFWKYFSFNLMFVCRK